MNAEQFAYYEKLTQELDELLESQLKYTKSRVTIPRCADIMEELQPNTHEDERCIMQTYRTVVDAIRLNVND